MVRRNHLDRNNPTRMCPVSLIAGVAGMLALVCCTGCPLALPSGGPDIVGAALAVINANGTLDLNEHCSRNSYNVCPAVRPELGTDADGITWTNDRFLGILPNPFHTPLDCLRGTAPELGLSSYQCCYDGDVLVDEGPLAGSFDFIDPQSSLLAMVWHWLFDVFPSENWVCPP